MEPEDDNQLMATQDDPFLPTGTDDKGTDKLIPPFYPNSEPKSGPEYREFMELRERVLDVIRVNSEEKQRAVDDLVESLLEHDYAIPTGPMELIQNIALLGQAYRAKSKKREAFRRIVTALLEQIFDPSLEFRMTHKDILDAFEANGIPRNSVSTEQISQIYVRVLQKMRVGELRDLTYQEELHRYSKIKLDEIAFSRQDWELNHR